MRKIVVIHSGGLDSTTMLYMYKLRGHRVKAISFDYGQRHVKELVIANSICAAIGVEHAIVDLSTIGKLLVGSSQTDPSIEVPEGHYTDATMRTTVVPNRNMMMIAAAAAWAIAMKFHAVAYGAHAGDHAIYPDCREPFVDAMNEALATVSEEVDSPIELLAPFLTMSKAGIVEVGAQLGVPFAQTWSCYKGDALHCGRCGTCVERREAFALAGVTDPTTYADGV